MAAQEIRGWGLGVRAILKDSGSGLMGGGAGPADAGGRREHLRIAQDDTDTDRCEARPSCWRGMRGRRGVVRAVRVVRGEES